MANPLMIAAGISGGASIIGSSKAAKAQQSATDATVNLQRDIYEDIKGLLSPFYDAGTSAINPYLYELGLLPEAPTIGGTPLSIETIAGEQQTVMGGSGSDFPAYNPADDQYEDYMSWSMAQQEHAAQAGTSQTTTGADRYKVGGEIFDTMEEAEAYAAANGEQIKYEGFEGSPYLDHMMNQGFDQIQASAAAGGNLESGATIKALEDYRRSASSADYNNYMAMLSGMMGSGQAAAGQQSAAGQTYAANAGNAMMQGGAVQAQGIMGATNAINGTIGQMSGIYGYMNPAGGAWGTAPAGIPMGNAITPSGGSAAPDYYINGLYS